MFDKPEVFEPESTSHEYDPISREYANITETDPSKRFVHYPESLRLIGDMEGKKVLDIGCGSGKFARMLAEKGAQVFAYDNSKMEIELARKIESKKNNGSNISYFVSSYISPAIKPEIKFDIASAVLVLPTVKNISDLEKMFTNVNKSLASNGKLVCLTVNPDFKRFGEILYKRRFTKKENGKNRVEFFSSDGSFDFDVEGTSFTKDEYEEALKKAGFSKFSWEPLHVLPEGKNVLGEKFWDKYEEDCPYIGLVAYKE